MIPAITIAIYEDGWEVSTHLQVGRRTFRYCAHTFPIISEVADFLEQWRKNWEVVACDVFGYEGIEDLNETDHGPISPDLSSVISALLPSIAPMKRRF